MKRTHRHLEIVVGTQVDYILPEGKAAIPQASQIIVPGMRRLMDLQPESCYGVLFVKNCFTEDEYPKSDYATSAPPHCLVAGFEDYEPVGVQNVFSSFLLSPRGIPVYRCYKKMKDVWVEDMWQNLPKVTFMRGAASHAETFRQFVGSMEQEGVSNVTIWGMDTEVDVAKAIDGFLVRGFKVKVMIDLCRSYAGTAVSPLNAKFNAAIASAQLEVIKYGDELQAAKRKPL